MRHFNAAGIQVPAVGDRGEMSKRERTRPLRQDVRTGVLEAAREVFAEVGYHRASLESIARKAGFSKGAVYSNFVSKDDLFFALLEPEALQMVEALTAPQEPSGDLDTDLETLAVGLEMLSTSTPANLLFAEFRAHAARDAALSARLATIRSSVVDQLTDRLPKELDRIGARLTIPARDAVTLLLSIVNGLALEHVGNPGLAVEPRSLAALLHGVVVPSAG
jgi:AcrR family transcriptional regulator